MFLHSQCLGIWSVECLVRVLEPQGYPAGLVRQDPCSQLMTLPALASLLAFRGQMWSSEPIGRLFWEDSCLVSIYWAEVKGVLMLTV